jgi:hypothetical protein
MITARPLGAREREGESVSDLEEALLWMIQADGLPAPEREVRFSPPRRWRFDLAYTADMLAIEVEGGKWTRGRHVRPSGFEEDCIKYNAAALLGWRVLRVTGDMVNDGRALATVRRALAQKERESA